MKQRGFTLIEVMVAMVIFAISAMAILSATGETINTLSTLKQKTLAAMVADNQLAILALEGTPQAEKSGTSAMAGTDWHWTLKPTATGEGSLTAIDVIVWTDKRKVSPLVSVRAYVTR